MAYQTPVSVTDVLRAIHNRSYVLPAIQREFEWTTDQVCRLFDSLIRGYPIGSFLSWQVSPAVASKFRFYDFLTDYHERNHPYAPQVAIPAGQGVTAILDGQQRLTALNIGLYGSHAERQPRKWASNPDSYPTKRLHLDVTRQDTGEAELDMAYGFRFLTDADARPREGELDRWYKVADVLHLNDSGPSIYRELQRRRLAEQPDAFQTLYELFRAVRDTKPINFYLEQNEDPDEVLDIFVRVNSAGTRLSNSDLLMSMTTNQWTELDARQEVRSLVDDLNGEHFNFTKDLVLKAGLVLIDAADVRFKVTNFTQQNAALMEKRWPELRTTLLSARSLLRNFGFAAQTLAATSVLIPVAYYLHSRGLGNSYVTSSFDAADRELVRSWVTRSLMKRGVWGSGLDTLLSKLRDVLRNSTGGFPADQLEFAMTMQGKPLRFEEAELDELLESRYGQPRTFATLAMLYPGLDLTKTFHVDHIFPHSLFTRSKLLKAGISSDRLDAYLNSVDSLPNLQLLPALPNDEKQAALPCDWLAGPHFPTPEKLEGYLEQNDLQGLPLDLDHFLNSMLQDENVWRVDSVLSSALKRPPLEFSREPAVRYSLPGQFREFRVCPFEIEKATELHDPCEQRGPIHMKIHQGNGDGLPMRRSNRGSEAQPTTGGLIRELHDFVLDIGFRAERRGELGAALELYTHAVSAQPDSALAWYNYGDILLAMGRYEEAVSPLTRAVELSPGTALFHYDLGLALFRLDRHEEASREFAGIVANDPQLQRASSTLVLSSLTNLALSQDLLGNPDEAANTLAPARQTAVDILYNLGRFKLLAKCAAEAVNLLQAAALLAPDSEEIIHGTGRALLDLKRESEAVPFLVRATKLNPRCTDAWYDLGLTLSRLKQRKKARSCFLKTLRLDPKHAGAYYDLACLDALDRKPNAAFENLEKAVARGFRNARHLRRDADLQSLRKDARWKAIVARINDIAKRD